MEELCGLERELELIDLDSRSLGQKAKDLYFKPKRVERWKNGRIYEWLGVKKFKKLCENIGHLIGKDNTSENNYFIWDKSLEGLKVFERKTRFNEAIHSPITILLTYSTINDLANGDYVGAAINGTLGVINGYAAILQRYNRARIENILEQRLEKNL